MKIRKSSPQIIKITGVELAEPWQRIGAFTINLLVFISVFIICFYLIFPWIARMDVPSHDDILDYLCLAGVIIMFAYLLYSFNTIISGQSLGKKLMKIKVVNLDGTNVGFFRGVVLRDGIFLFLFGFTGLRIIFGAVFVVMMFTDENRQTLQDKMVGTIVIKKT